jgi:ribonuclease P protein component
MTRANWLKSGSDFEKVFTRGKIFKTDNFILYYHPGHTQGIRIGICVGKSLGSAVIRNRLKRQIREIVRQLDLICNNCDIVIVARRSLVDREFTHIYESLLRLFLKTGLIENEKSGNRSN